MTDFVDVINAAIRGGYDHPFRFGAISYEPGIGFLASGGELSTDQPIVFDKNARVNVILSGLYIKTTADCGLRLSDGRFLEGGDYVLESGRKLTFRDLLINNAVITAGDTPLISSDLTAMKGTAQ